MSNGVLWGLNIVFRYLICLKTSVNCNVLFSTLNYFGQKWISKVYLEITHLEIRLSMSYVLTHANCLNAVIEFSEDRSLT